ncbi:hypothetical protein FBU30_009955, partial [Linnemannia zychae]
MTKIKSRILIMVQSLCKTHNNRPKTFEKQLNEYDAIVIGSGATGMIAALTARKHGFEVIIIEKSGYFGETTARPGWWDLGSK